MTSWVKERDVFEKYIAFSLPLNSRFRNSYCPAEYTEKDPITCNFDKEALNFFLLTDKIFLLNWTYIRKSYLDELFCNTNVTDLILVFICGYFSRIRFHYFLHEVNIASCVLGIHGFGRSCCLFNICGRKLTKFIAFHVYFHYLLKNGVNTPCWVLNIATTWVIFARKKDDQKFFRQAWPPWVNSWNTS